MSIPLVLASASPARLATLRSAGIEPKVIVSHVDEDAVLAAATTNAADGFLSPAEAVLVLARAKAEAVIAAGNPLAYVLGCDSMLEFEGETLGKPADAAEAASRWRAMRGRSGVLHTGHWLINGRVKDGKGEWMARGATASTTVYFADLEDHEVDAYVSTGEPMLVAGAFTIDGLGGPFIERIEGDHHNVVGLSLPLLRHLLADLGVGIHRMWVGR